MIDQAIQHVHQLVDIIKVQTCGGFIQDKESLTCGWSYQFSGEFDSLRFTPREARGALPELDVIEPYVAHDPQHPGDLVLIVEQLQSFSGGRFQDVVDIAVSELDIQDPILKSLALASFAHDPYVG